MSKHQQGVIVILALVVSATTWGYVIPKYEKNPEEGDLFEGDIAGIERGAAQIPTQTHERWPYGIIPYEIDTAAFTMDELITMRAGMKLVEDRTRISSRDCIKFVPRTTENVYIRVIKDGGCWSYVGKQKVDGPQLLSLDCDFPVGTVAHEFIHALGFFHEQSRPDRDDYINVMYENMTPGAENNFNKYEFSQIDILGMQYDYGSVMHYSPYGFSKNGLPTIVPKDSNANIGQRKDLSRIDISEIRYFYRC